MTPPTRDQILAVARLQGCTCEPEITTTTDAELTNLHHSTIAHDSWCPLLMARSSSTN